MSQVISILRQVIDESNSKSDKDFAERLFGKSNSGAFLSAILSGRSSLPEKWIMEIELEFPEVKHLIHDLVRAYDHDNVKKKIQKKIEKFNKSSTIKLGDGEFSKYPISFAAVQNAEERTGDIIMIPWVSPFHENTKVELLLHINQDRYEPLFSKGDMVSISEQNKIDEQSATGSIFYYFDDQEKKHTLSYLDYLYWVSPNFLEVFQIDASLYDQSKESLVCVKNKFYVWGQDLINMEKFYSMFKMEVPENPQQMLTKFKNTKRTGLRIYGAYLQKNSTVKFRHPNEIKIKGVAIDHIRSLNQNANTN